MYVPYVVGVVGATVSGTLVYFGLANRLERRHYRIRIQEGWEEGKNELIAQSQTSKLETLLKQARYPLTMNALKTNVAFIILFFFLLLNYIFFPSILAGQMKLVPFVIGLGVLIGLYPAIPISPTRFILNRLIEYRQAKRNAELFSLYDMLVSEIEMMQSSRVNVYSLLRSLQPYFNNINTDMATMLSDWTSATIGPYKAIDRFSETVGTNEAKSLATVLKTFDESSRENLIVSLRGMEDLFITSQIENNRRKQRMFLDVISMPVSVTHFLIALNFVYIFIVMVMKIMGDSSINI